MRPKRSSQLQEARAVHWPKRQRSCGGPAFLDTETAVAAEGVSDVAESVPSSSRQFILPIGPVEVRSAALGGVCAIDLVEAVLLPQYGLSAAAALEISMTGGVLGVEQAYCSDGGALMCLS